MWLSTTASGPIDGKLKSGATSAGLAENALTITNEGSKVELDPSSCKPPRRPRRRSSPAS
jgi:hypothetical protein